MRPTIPLLATLLVASVALVGCATTPVTDEAGTEPAPEPTAEVWVIDFDHIGPLAIDTTFLELGALQPGLAIDDFGGYCGAAYWPDADQPWSTLSALAESQGSSGPVDALSLYVYQEPTEGLPRTAEGIGLGSTRDEVLAAYPDAVESPHHYVEGGSYLDVENGAGLAMQFATDGNGVVDSIGVGRIPQVYYVEGCA